MTQNKETQTKKSHSKKTECKKKQTTKTENKVTKSHAPKFTLSVDCGIENSGQQAPTKQHDTHAKSDSYDAFWPVLQAQDLPFAWPKPLPEGLPEAISPCAVLVFTSKHAVQSVFAHLDALGHLGKLALELEFAAVGQSTARHLQQALNERIDVSQAVGRKKVLIPAHDALGLMPLLKTLFLPESGLKNIARVDVFTSCDGVSETILRAFVNDESSSSHAQPSLELLTSPMPPIFVHEVYEVKSCLTSDNPEPESEIESRIVGQCLTGGQVVLRCRSGKVLQAAIQRLIVLTCVELPAHLPGNLSFAVKEPTALKMLEDLELEARNVSF